MIFYKLSGNEVDAIQKLRETSLKRLNGWATKEDWEKIPLKAFEEGHKQESAIELSTGIRKIEKLLTKAMRPQRDSLRVVKFSDGKIEELHDDPYRKEAETALEKRKETKPDKKKRQAVATTVAQPVLGCPAPDFDTVHLKATRVLKTFLTPQQIYDFERRQRFIVVGADTGHRYMLTSRNAPDELARGFSRTVFDLDEKLPYCVHDWTIPAEEELLTMAMFLRLPRRENYIRAIPDPLRN